MNISFSVSDVLSLKFPFLLPAGSLQKKKIKKNDNDQKQKKFEQFLRNKGKDLKLKKKHKCTHNKCTHPRNSLFFTGVNKKKVGSMRAVYWIKLT